jgi:zinc transporter ZupT
MLKVQVFKGWMIFSVPTVIQFGGDEESEAFSKLCLWGLDQLAIISGVAALLGYTIFSRFSGEVIAATTALAAGAILAMLSDTMIPEAFEESHNFAGLITVLEFLAAFILTKISL